MVIVRLFREHRTFVVLLATIILTEIAHGIEIVSILPLYLTKHFHETETFVGLAASAYLFVDALLTRTPAGWLTDRWGRKRTLLLGLAFSAAPIVAMMFVGDAFDFIPINIVNGIGAGMIWPAIYSMVADAYGREQRGTVLGLVNMVMLGGIAAGGPIVGNVLLDALGYPAPGAFTYAFVACLVLILLAFTLVVFFAHELPHTQRVQETGEGSIRNAPLNFVLLLFIGLMITFAMGLIVPVITLFGTDVMRVPPRVFALVLVPPALTAALVLIPAGRWADRAGRELPLLLGLIIIAIPFWGAPLSIDPVIVSSGGVLAGLGYALLVPAWNALIMDWIPAQARGVFLGAIATVQGVGLALGPAVGGALWNQIGVYAPFTASAVLFSFAVGCAALLFIRRRQVQAGLAH